MKFIYTLALCAVYPFAIGQQLPETEIYLFDLKISESSLTLSNPVNISNHKGYDNQPFFHPSKPLLYYASANSDGRTDILSYQIRTAETRKITDTNEREYSPTVTPDEKFISCIIQRDNGEQNLGMYSIEGGVPIVVINNLTVGYHAWADNTRLVAFILGQPNSLHLIDLKTRLDTVVAPSISRSLHRIPGSTELSFLQKTVSELWEIRKVDAYTLEVTPITQTMDGREHDINWTPDGKIIASDDHRILYFDTKNDDAGWHVVRLPGDFKKTITRLAVDPTGTKMALVVAE